MAFSASCIPCKSMFVLLAFQLKCGEKIAVQYHGDLREHITQTQKIVEPLIEKLAALGRSPARCRDADLARDRPLEFPAAK
jgi:hypothetical protein